MHNTQEIPDIKLQDVELTVLPLNHDVSRFDFSISLAETQEGISGQSAILYGFVQGVNNEAFNWLLFGDSAGMC
jgi:hypothetical protein